MAIPLLIIGTQVKIKLVSIDFRACFPEHSSVLLCYYKVQEAAHRKLNVENRLVHEQDGAGCSNWSQRMHLERYNPCEMFPQKVLVLKA